MKSKDYLKHSLKSKLVLAIRYELDRNDPNFEFYEDPEKRSNKYYLLCLEKMKKDEKTTLYVDFDHINSFQYNYKPEGGSMPNQIKDLSEDLLTNFYRYEPNLRKALFNCMLRFDQGYARNKVFFIAFYNLPTCFKLRDMKTNVIGRLASIYGTVTRTTEVRPELLNGTFLCKDCNTTIPDIEQQFKYTIP